MNFICKKKLEELRKISWTEFNKRKQEETIEHIYPRTAREECCTSVFNQYSEDERNILLHSLGNLVLLSRSKNSILQNKCFALKKGDTEKGNTVGFYNGSYSEIEVSRYDKWTKEEIQDRGKKMLDFLDERWGVDIQCWEKEWRVIKKGAFKENLLNNQPQEKIRIMAKRLRSCIFTLMFISHRFMHIASLDDCNKTYIPRSICLQG